MDFPQILTQILNGMGDEEYFILLVLWLCISSPCIHTYDMSWQLVGFERYI